MQVPRLATSSFPLWNEWGMAEMRVTPPQPWRSRDELYRLDVVAIRRL